MQPVACLNGAGSGRDNLVLRQVAYSQRSLLGNKRGKRDGDITLRSRLEGGCNACDRFLDGIGDRDCIAGMGGLLRS